MNDEMAGYVVAAIERIANAQEAQVKFLQDSLDLRTRRQQLDDEELELKGLIRSYRMMIRDLQVAKEEQ